MIALDTMTFRQAKSRFRTRVAMQLKKQRWIIPSVAILCAVATALAILRQAGPALALAATLSLFATTYLWGFATRAFRPPRWPPTSQFHQQEYAAVWDTLAVSPQAAALAAAGKRYEEDLRESAAPTIQNLSELVGIAAQDDVLEIGCGVGRIGRELAPLCRSWTGSDISKNMLAYASERLVHLHNARFQLLQGNGLREFAEETFDVVYCTNMLAHLDELDRWRYVQEALRVLRSGGRLFVDSIDIESDEGCVMFTRGPTPDLEPGRPPYMPRSSTAAELKNYANRAGFEQVQAHRRPPLVILSARKP
jgi:SAM-dependent methyltransferase